MREEGASAPSSRRVDHDTRSQSCVLTLEQRLGHIDAEQGPRDDGAPEARRHRGQIWLKLARLWNQLLDHENAARALEEAGKLAPDSEVSEEAERLRAAWRR